MMDSFERRLKSLPLAQPPDGLRDRIFGAAGARVERHILLARRIALGWAAVFAVVTGLAGFAFGHLSQHGSAGITPLQSSIEVRIVEAASKRPDFDLTTTPADFLTGDVRVEIETQEEI